VIAVVPVRGGLLAAGSEEAIAEAGGLAVVAGDGAAEAAAELAERASALRAGGECRELRALELGASFRPAEWAIAIAPHVESAAVVVLPASPDGRDLAPRLATLLKRPLLAGAIEVTREGAALAWRQGRQVVRFGAEGPFVATLLPGSRSALAALGGGDGGMGEVTPGGASPGDGAPRGGTSSGGGTARAYDGGRARAAPTVLELTSPVSGGSQPGSDAGEDGVVGLSVRGSDPELLEVIAADPAVMDLAEAERIVAAGAGLGGPEQLALLEVVATKLGASLGATRVVTDAGWLGHDRQIGTTGVSVRPRCYLAFGISGAAQHVGGLGAPRHVVSVNIDRSCPMMAMSELALVTDAKALVEVLARRLTECEADP